MNVPVRQLVDYPLVAKLMDERIEAFQRARRPGEKPGECELLLQRMRLDLDRLPIITQGLPRAPD